MPISARTLNAHGEMLGKNVFHYQPMNLVIPSSILKERAEKIIASILADQQKDKMERAEAELRVKAFRFWRMILCREQREPSKEEIEKLAATLKSDLYFNQLVKLQRFVNAVEEADDNQGIPLSTEDLGTFGFGG